MNEKLEATKELKCDCLCSSCAGEKAHYSDYHCHHAKEDGLEKGAYESKGFCVKTGFMPETSWRRFYTNWHTKIKTF